MATERLWELADAGETIGAIATGYDLPEDEVRAAVAYEEQFRSLAAQRSLPARFSVDENKLALGRQLAEAHGNVVYPPAIRTCPGSPGRSRTSGSPLSACSAWS